VVNSSLLVAYYGALSPARVSDPHRALTAVDRYSLLSGTVDVEDCILGMLSHYVLLGTKREQVRLVGNAVTPPAARDLMCAVAESLGAELETVA